MPEPPPPDALPPPAGGRRDTAAAANPDSGATGNAARNPDSGVAENTADNYGGGGGPGGRFVPLRGCVNFRDLGGYPGRDGRRVKAGRLFRSDALQDLTPEDAVYLKDGLGLAAIIDLRNTDEAARDGTGLLPGLGLSYAHFPLLDGRGIPPIAERPADGHSNAGPGAAGWGRNRRELVHRLSDIYLWILDNSGGQLAAAVNAIAGRLDRPLVFHCSAGKDRTGMLAALLLELLGVAPEIRAVDYLLTNLAVDGILRRTLKVYPGAHDSVDSVRAQPLAFQQFQDKLRADGGGTESYLRRYGVTDAALARLRGELLA